MIIFNLKEIMDDKDISINKLSTETGINRASLTSIANNESKMVQLATIESLLDYLKIDLSDLMLDVSDSAQI
uniref:helix-turn-helix domain-containing protein n=3 Tax=Lactobacillaceae TaxID=33958 RepID=UPI001300FDE6